MTSKYVPDITQYEPPSLYQLRQQSLSQPKQPSQVTNPIQPKGILELGLDTLGLPQQMLFSGLQGKSILQPLQQYGQEVGFGLGIAPPPPRTPPIRFGDILAQAGTPEMKIADTPLGTLTGRNILGTIGDVALDPLNLAFGAGAVGKAGQAARGIEAARTATGALGQVGRVAEGMAGLTPPPSLLQKGTQLPGILGKAVNKFSDLIDPRVMATNAPETTLLRGFDEAEELAQNATRADVGSLMAKPMTTVVDANGLMPTVQGSLNAKMPTQALAYLDVVEDTNLSKQLLSPQDNMFWDSAFPLRNNLMNERQVKLDILEKLAPQAAKRFKADMMTLAPGQRHWERYLTSPDGAEMLMIGKRIKPIGANRTQLPFKRVYPNATMAIKDGYKLASPEETVAKTLDNLQHEINLIDTTIQTIHSGVRKVLKPKASRGQGLVDISYAGMFKGIWFTPEAGKAIANKFNEKIPEALQPFLKVSGLARFMGTGFDMGYPMIQGFPTLVTNPKAFFGGVKVMFQSALDPSFNNRLINSIEFRNLQRETGFTVGRGESEFFEEMGPQGLFTKVAGKIPVIGKSLQSGAMRMQAAFDTPGNYLRMQITASLRDSYVKSGKSLRELGRYADQMTGVWSSAGSGISKQQSAVEQLLLFAPRYFKASLALVGNALRSGPNQAESLKTLASMAYIGPYMYMKLADLAGEEPVLDPSDSRFMTLRIGDQRIGFGGNFLSLARFLGRSIDNKPDPENPLVQFWRGKTSPIAGSVIDIANNETYMGTPLNDLGDVSLYLGTRLLPFWLQSLIMENPPKNVKEGVLQTVSQLAGMRQFPVGYSEERERIANEKYGVGYDQLNPEQRATIDADKTLKAIPALQGKKFAGQQLTTASFDKERQALEVKAQAVDNGQISKKQFREAQADINSQMGSEIELIRQQYPGKEKELSQAESIRQQYYELINTEDVAGRPGFEAAEEFLNKQTPEVKQYIEQTQIARFKRIGGRAGALMEDLWNDRRTLKPYWDIRDTVYDRYGLNTKLKGMNPAEQEVYLKTDKRVARANSEVTRRREQLRMRNREVDAALVEWGYVSKSIRERKK